MLLDCACQVQNHLGKCRLADIVQSAPVSKITAGVLQRQHGFRIQVGSSPDDYMEWRFPHEPFIHTGIAIATGDQDELAGKER